MPSTPNWGKDAPQSACLPPPTQSARAVSYLLWNCLSPGSVRVQSWEVRAGWAASASRQPLDHRDHPLALLRL